MGKYVFVSIGTMACQIARNIIYKNFDDALFYTCIENEQDYILFNENLSFNCHVVVLMTSGQNMEKLLRQVIKCAKEKQTVIHSIVIPPFSFEGKIPMEQVVDMTYMLQQESLSLSVFNEYLLRQEHDVSFDKILHEQDKWVVRNIKQILAIDNQGSIDISESFQDYLSAVIYQNNILDSPLSQSRNLEYLLGELYYSDNIVKQDYSKSLMWFTKAAKQNVPEAQYKLGFMYYYGIGTKQDSSEAMPWLLKAAACHIQESYLLIGKIYLEKKDYDNGIIWLKKDYETGGKKGIVIIIRKVKKRPELRNDIFKWLLQNKSPKDEKVMFCLGLMYEEGWGTLGNDSEAFHWYVQAADKGHSEACYNVGYMYESGIGTYKDDKKAFNYYMCSAKQGNRDAIYAIAEMYYKSNEYEAAFKWYGKAAKRDYPIAFYKMGYMYESGIGTRMNIKFAYEWYLKAYRSGYLQAWEALENMYRKGSLKLEWLLNK